MWLAAVATAFPFAHSVHQYCWDTPDLKWEDLRLKLEWVLAPEHERLEEWAATRKEMFHMVEVIQRLDFSNAEAVRCAMGFLTMRLYVLSELPVDQVLARLPQVGPADWLMLVGTPWHSYVHLKWPAFRILQRLALLTRQALPGPTNCGPPPPLSYDQAMTSAMEPVPPECRVRGAAVRADLARHILENAADPFRAYNASRALIWSAQEILGFGESSVPLEEVLGDPAGAALFEALVQWGAVVDRSDRIGSRGGFVLAYDLPPSAGPPNVQTDVPLHELVGDLSPTGSMVRHWLGHLRNQFYASQPVLEDFVANFSRLDLARHLPRPFSFVDVGAGVWDDDCLIVDVIQQFGCGAVRLDAFEPLQKNNRLLHDHLHTIPEAVNALETGCLRVHKAAVSNTTGRRTIYGRGRLASLTYKDIYRRDMDGAEEEVEVTTLDAWVANNSRSRIDFLKIDVEGAEWQVLEGAMGMMRARQITLIVIEYGNFWSRHTWEAANLRAPARPVSTMDWPTLRGVVAKMRAVGYEAYFFGTPHLVPLSGTWWHDIYEVCRDPHNVLYRGIFGWCWFDILFVEMSHPIATEIHEHFVPWHALPTQPRYRATAS